MFYAEKNIYGVGIHPQVSIYKFRTKAERDKWVKEHDTDPYHRAYPRKVSELNHEEYTKAEVWEEE